MLRTLTACCLACIVMFTSTLTLAGSSTVDNKKSEVNFIIKAKTATVTGLSSNHDYRVTLLFVRPSAWYLGIGSSKTHGLTPLEKLAHLWVDGDFKTNPPNAFLLASPGLKQPRAAYTIVVTKVHYDYWKQQLSFNAHVLDGHPMPMTDITNADHVVLFIDSVCTGCMF